jgi:hypothetical protein
MLRAGTSCVSESAIIADPKPARTAGAVRKRRNYSGINVKFSKLSSWYASCIIID